MTKLKICGITNKVDALVAMELGVDMLGFVFYKKSKRYLTPAMAEDIINELPPKIAKVGVFLGEKKEDVIKIAEDVFLDTLQFHGDETPEYCSFFMPKYKVIKAFRVKDRGSLKQVNDYNTNYYLFDTYADESAGGTGTAFDWSILKDFKILKPIILSGGLEPDNVGRAIKELVPFAVDVSSGVESAPGKKDHAKVRAFIAAAKAIA